MSDLLAHVRDANEAWADRATPDEWAKVPGRQVAVVTCMDARVDPLGMLGLELGDAHVVRNAGGIVTDDVERSVLLSQYALQTRTVLVIGHTDCGLLGHDEDATADQVEQTRGSRPWFALGSIPSAEEGVRRSVTRLRESSVLAHVDDVHGYVYDVDSARLTAVEVDAAAD